MNRVAALFPRTRKDPTEAQCEWRGRPSFESHFEFPVAFIPAGDYCEWKPWGFRMSHPKMCLCGMQITVS